MIPLVLPQLSISMEEATVLRWLVADGEEVQQGQAVVEVETDKATMEVEAPGGGTIRRVVDEGAVVAVESVLAEILDGEATAVAPPPTEERALVAAAAAPAPEASNRLLRTGPRRASPAARRLARERGLDLASVAGSGPGGRVVARDLASNRLLRAPGAERLRTAVVANLEASWQRIPHIHVGGELEADGLAAAKRAAPTGTTVTDLLVAAVAVALREVPELNGGSDRVHLALAVAAPAGVVAPVLRDAGSLSLAQISRERARLVAAARAGTPDPRDLAGGTATLSNLGAYPVDFFAPIVSGPQTALVATGRLVEKPVAVDGMLAVRHRLWANVAIDHTKADGEAGGRFLAALERAFRAAPDLTRTEGEPPR